jgi:uncharacterized protein YraI
MKRTSKISLALAAALTVGATAAQAASGYTINKFYLFTGPGHSFERLESVPENSRVQILGCTPNFKWCDVSWGGARGWMDANGIETYSRGRRVIVANEGPYIRLPTITYSRSYDDDIEWARV